LRKTSALRRFALAAAVVGAVVPPLRSRLNLPRPVVSAVAWQSPVALALAFPRTRARDAGIYALQMWAYFAHYAMPADDEDEIMRRLRVDYPVRFDTALGRGVTPTLRLQRLLGRKGEVRPHDTLLSAVHWAWFIVPHGTVAYVLLKDRDQYPRAASQIAGVFDLGLVGYWAMPTAPPWWAGSNGHMPEVRRIMIEAGERFWGKLWGPLYDSLQGNQFAAMPSLHFATSVMAAHVLSDTGRAQGIAGWAYAGTLGFALVYLGEHYVLDLLVGLGLAEAVRHGIPAVAPLFASLEDGLRTLEPAGGS
jgi:membrane-associated phospholipid phosphatase